MSLSLLHRWSLPSRGFVRDKSQDEASSGQSKFPTIHIGQLGPRRRPNLSSSFSTLFEKPENRCRIRNVEGHSDAADDLPLLVPRRENAPSDITFRYSHSHEYQDTASPIKVPSPRRSDRVEPASQDVQLDRTKPPPYLVPKNLSQDTHQISETPKIRSFSLSSTETAKNGSPDGPLTQQLTVTTGHGETIRSASSSYPSEGIRSPFTRCSTPEPVTARTKNYLAEYRRYSQYPSQSVFNLSSMPASEEYAAGGTAEENSQVALDNSHTVAKPSEEDLTELACPSTVHSDYQQQRPSANGEATVPVLENEDAISSPLEASCTSSPRRNVRDMSDDGHGSQLEGRGFASTDRLRLSRDTDTTMLTAIKRTSVSDGEDVWFTIHGEGEGRLSRPASWLQLFTVSASNRSSNTLAQRMQRLKLRKWVKRACFKTKARLQLVGRPVSTVGRASSEARHRKQRHLKKKKKKVNAAKKGIKGVGKRGEKSWSVGKTLDATKERAIQHMKMADGFFGSLAKRKSLQFGLLRSEKQSKALPTHKRVQSCPSSIHL
ncbi:hypothetical protein GGS24DRAFT_474001 [Hypoxylon argillaceum]|nr:hypothetical protein GGS24DRAFT_474001 [Hypoxylon argillaceum]